MILLNNIKIVGGNCSNGIKLIKMVNKFVDNYHYLVTVEVIDEKKSINDYRITDFPGLIINGTLVSEGKVITDREISRYVKSLA